MIQCTKCTKSEATTEVTRIKGGGKVTMDYLCTECFNTDKWSWLDYRTYTFNYLHNNSTTTKLGYLTLGNQHFTTVHNTTTQ